MNCVDEALPPPRCFVVGPTSCVDSLFLSLVSSGSAVHVIDQQTTADSPHRPIITVTRPRGAHGTRHQNAKSTPPLVLPSSSSSSSSSSSTLSSQELDNHKGVVVAHKCDNVVVVNNDTRIAVHECDKLQLLEPTIVGDEEGSSGSSAPLHKKVCSFWRYNRDDGTTTSVGHEIHSVLGKIVLLFLYCAEHQDSYMSLSFILQRLINTVKPLSLTLFLVDFSGPRDTLATEILHTLFSIHMAFCFYAYKMLKWTEQLGALDTLLSLISDAPDDPPSSYLELAGVPNFRYFLPLKSELVPLPVIPTILDITCADVTTAHMIMQLVHDYRSQFPFFTASMALRAWFAAKNEAAVNVVCLARSLTESENINLSHLKFESVPESLRRLTCRTLNLSNNNIQKIPKWLAEMPNVRLGVCHPHIIGDEQNATTNLRQHRVHTDTHKLVIVGDTGVGKTTLLRCMMENKRKLKTKHVHTGIDVHHDVRFKDSTATTWTVWDLGGDSLSPFHQWFLLSRSVFLLVFDVSKALMMEEPHMAVYRWLNEISVARSRGDKVRRTIVPVGTHIEGIDPDHPKLAELITRIFMFEDVGFVFLLDLNTGKSYSCSKYQVWLDNNHSKGLPFTFILDDGTPNSVPEAWMILNKKIIRKVHKEKLTALTWAQFIQEAKTCGTTQQLEIEQCANFLADIGTIIHFRYQSWLGMELHDLVIVDPRSFLLSLSDQIKIIRFPERGNTRILQESPPPLGLGLRAILHHEFINLDSILSGAPPFENGYLSFLPMPCNTRSSALDHFKANSSLTAVLSGRSIRFPLFPQELFFKAILRFDCCLDGWKTQFWKRDETFLSHSCAHSGSSKKSAFLFISCQNGTVTIYMRSECVDEHCWPTTKRAYLWTRVMDILHSLDQSIYNQFEEKSEPLFPAVVELFACPHCLQGWWFHSNQQPALPPLFWFQKNAILEAVKNSVPLLTCGKGYCKVGVAEVAPDIVELHKEACDFVSEAVAIIVMESIKINCTLGELLTLLIEKGNGTTSVLEKVLPISLRLKMLHDVAKGLQCFHQHSIVHGRISTESIIVLSLDDSGAGPWAKIKYQGWPVSFPTPLEDDVTLLPPEVLCNPTLQTSSSSDVWSFGITASLLLDPLKKPYSHIMSINYSTNNKYLCTDYDRNKSPNSNNHNAHHLHPYTTAIGLDLLRGSITPVPPPSSLRGSHTSGGGVDVTGVHHSKHKNSQQQQQQKMCRLGHEIVRQCLMEPSCPKSIDTILKVWDYFLPESRPHTS